MVILYVCLFTLCLFLRVMSCAKMSYCTILLTIYHLSVTRGVTGTKKIMLDVLPKGNECSVIQFP